MLASDIVQYIKLQQIKQGITTAVLARRLGISYQHLIDLRGYRRTISPELFDRMLGELSVTDITQAEKEYLLGNQTVAKEYRHKQYTKKQNKKG